MSPNWRWCLKLGLLIVLIDLLAVAIGQAGAGNDDVNQLAESFDNIANLVIFGYIGWRTGQFTGRATASAEAGVVASLLPGLVAALLVLFPPNGGPPADLGDAGLPLANQLIGAVALNIVMGGLMAWLGGVLATRGRGAGPK
jgi:hypothetical protein